MAEKQKKANKPDKNAEELKLQLFQLITNDKDFLLKIAEFISTSIVENILNSDEFIKNLTDQLTKSDDLSKSIAHQISDSVKQDVYESLSHDQKELEDKHNSFGEKMANLEEINLKLQEDIDSFEQYGRRNCLLLHGIPESKDQPTREDTAMDLFNSKLKLKITKADLDRSHRLALRKQKARPRPIIVKFTSYNKRSEVFRVKKHLKGSGISISESLTPQRQALLNTVKQHPAVTSSWTMDGRIICLLPSNNKVVIERKKDLSKLTQTGWADQTESYFTR